MVDYRIGPLLFSTEFLKFFKAWKIGDTTIPLTITIGFMMIGMVNLPRKLRDHVDNTQKESKDSIQPLAFE